MILGDRVRDHRPLRVLRLLAQTLVIILLGNGFGCVSSTPQAVTDEVIYPTEMPPTPPDVDVVDHFGQFSVEDGFRDKFVRLLDGAVPRPWTVERLAAAYSATLNPRRRKALAYVLAASRSSMGLRVAGNALFDRDPEVASWAALGIEVYWIEEGLMEGGSAARDRLVHEWWDQRKADLEAAETDWCLDDRTEGRGSRAR